METSRISFQKKLSSLFLLCILSLLCSLHSAQARPLPQEQTQKLDSDNARHQPTVRKTLVIIGGDFHYPPYEFLDKHGEPSGFNVDLSRAIAEVTSLDIHIKLGLWKDMRDALNSGKIDILQGVSYSTQRAHSVSFSEPYSSVEYAIFTRENSGAVTTLEEMNGRSVIVESGGAMYDLIRSEYPHISIIPAYNHENALRKLASGAGDFALVSKVAGQYMIRKAKLEGIRAMGTPISLERYCYATVHHPELLPEINRGLEILKNNGTYQRLCDKWLSEPQVGLSTAEVIKYGSLVVAPLFTLFVLSVLWSKMLHRKVEERTEELQREIQEHLKVQKELEAKQKLIVHSDRMTSLGIMASGIAHEVNNPNGMTLMNIPILQDSYNDALEVLDDCYETHGDFLLGGLPYSRMRDEIPQMLGDMLSGAKHIKNIVRDLKEFSRKGDPEDMEMQDVNRLAMAATRLVRSMIKKSTRRFTVALAPDLPPVMASAQRIQQVIVNLLLNACQALENTEQGITLSTLYDAECEAVVLLVSDGGIGIPHEHMDKITNPFFTTKRERGGTGLGLSVSTSILKEHCGALEFKSVPGMGTTVTMSIPSATDSAAPTPPQNTHEKTL